MTGRAAPALAATLERCRVVVRWTLPGPDVSARLTLATGPGHAPFSLHADAVRYGRLRLPRLPVDWIVRNFDPTPRLRRLPMVVPLAPVALGRERLEIGDPKETGMVCPEETR